ncbi:YcxB family protein [Suipraeoptans intestinalis]|uniref:YcxB family protein n=1 Tax=Suipraeoptans intestinalis TaxID=2606628 RepID=A0A6N7UTJ7_9FIRM|nr:YcxB family protein [Suipraeoptans intestinalis]MDD7771033.1 YcxB family protein [Suipraeoptans intestinalis]MSR94384.1 YcxB family protein [Suipraeoptans intestinalis]
MPIETEIKMDGDSMGDFMIYHIYTSGSGIVILVLGILNISFGIAFLMKGKWGMAVIFLVLAALVFGIFPWLIRRKVKKQMERAKHLTEPIRYIFQEDGIETITAADRGKASWKKFRRVVWRGRVLILYDDKRQAILLPVEQVKEQLPAVIELLRRKLPASEIKIPASKLAALNKQG